MNETVATGSTNHLTVRVCAIGLRGFPAVIGGIERHCENLYPRMLEEAPNLELYVIGRSRYVDAATLRQPRLYVRRLWAPRMRGAEAFVHTLIAMIYALCVIRPHLIHLHGIGPGSFCLLSKLFKVPTVVTHHARDYDRPKWGLLGRTFLRLAEGVIARCADRIVCVSGAVQQSLVSLHPAAAPRTTVIRNGSALAGEFGANDDILPSLGLEPQGYVLAVGRIDATKGFHDLIEAFQAVSPAGKKLVIAGSSTEPDRYSQDMAQLGSDRIRFIGYQSDRALRALYENAALFVHPSYMEGYALVVAEALSLGTPIALSDIPPHREFALPDACYFAPGDIRALSQILGQPSYDRHLAGNAAEILIEDNWDRCAERHVTLFLSLARAPITRAG